MKPRYKLHLDGRLSDITTNGERATGAMHPEQIKAGLRMSGWTQAALADQLGVAPSSLAQAISGHIKSERIQGEIARILGKTVQEIWPGQVCLRRSRAQMPQQADNRQEVRP